MAITARFLADFDAFKASAQSAESSLKSLEATGTHLGATMDGVKDGLASVGQALGLAFTVDKLIGFGHEILAAGDHIQKMADQTSLGTAEVQKLMYIAGQSGTSIESLVGAVQNLQVRLGDENSGAAGAMAKLGIQSAAFARLGTYEQMTTLADAIRAIPNPTDQASAAAAIFGKTWKEILPAIKSGMQEVGDQAPIMADATVKALDAIGDAQTRAKGQAIAWGGSVVLAIEEAGFALGDYLSMWDPEHFGVATSEILKLQGELNDPDGLKGALASIKPVIQDVATGFTEFGATSKADLGGIKLAEMDLTAAAEASMVVNKERAKEFDAALKIELTSVEQTTELWNEHFRTLRDETLSTTAVQKNAIHDWFDDQVAKLDDNDANWQNHYDALEAIATDRLHAVDVATAKIGATAVDACDEAISAFSSWNTEIMDVTVSLDGAVRSVKELAAARAMGGSTTYDLGSAEGRAKVPADIAQWLHNGYSLEQAARLAYSLKMGFDISRDPLFQTKGPRVPGFAGGVTNFAGGLAMVGERGPELVNLPSGSSVFPHGTGGGAGAVYNFYLVDNTENLARKVSNLIVRGVKQGGPY